MQLARRHFQDVGASLAEIAIAWFGRHLPPVQIQGLGHLESAVAKGKGVILLSGHFTTLELTGQFVTPLTPRFAFMFRTRSNPLLDAMQRRGRRRTAPRSFSNMDSRAMLRALRDNTVVWYAPDQACTGKGAELLPFFGEPAMTNTATARLARISGAAIVPFRFCRLDDGSGYALRFDEPRYSGRGNDAIADTRQLTTFLEDSIRDCPSQYLWIHRRFRGRPNLPDPYARQRPDRRNVAVDDVDGRNDGPQPTARTAVPFAGGSSRSP
jgi:KDO2-lipid IV(A) lauroyltransferase